MGCGVERPNPRAVPPRATIHRVARAVPSVPGRARPPGRRRRARGGPRAARMQKERARANADRERTRARGERHADAHAGLKAGGSGERADANSEFARKYNLDDKELGTGAFGLILATRRDQGRR